jgi:hypothetical protein
MVKMSLGSHLQSAIHLFLVPVLLAAAGCSGGGSSQSSGKTRWSGTAPGYVVLLPSNLTIQEGMTGTVSVRAFDGRGAALTAPQLVVAPSAIATISGTSVSALSAGTATIYAIDAIGRRPVGTVTVLPSQTSVPAGVAQVAAAPPYVVVVVGGSQPIAAEALGLDGHPLAQAITYASQNTAVATVDAQGVVHGVASGTTAISISTSNAVASFTVGVTVASPSSGGAASPSLVSVWPAIGYSGVTLWAGGGSFSTPMVLTYRNPDGTVEMKTTTEGEWTSIATPVLSSPHRGSDAASVDVTGTVTPHRCGTAVIQFDPKDPTGYTASFPVGVSPDWSGTWTCVNGGQNSCSDKFVSSMHPIVAAPIVYPLGAFYDPLNNYRQAPTYGNLFAIDSIIHRDYTAAPYGATFTCSNVNACKTDTVMWPIWGDGSDCDGNTITIRMPIDGPTPTPNYEYTCTKRAEDVCAAGGSGTCSTVNMYCCFAYQYGCDCESEGAITTNPNLVTCDGYINWGKSVTGGSATRVASCPPPGGGMQCTDSLYSTGTTPMGGCQCYHP